MLAYLITGSVVVLAALAAAVDSLRHNSRIKTLRPDGRHSK